MYENHSLMEITYLGQSGFKFSEDGSTVLIDPFDKVSGDIEGDLVYCTHGHTDHIGGIPSFMDRNPDAILLANDEVAGEFKQYSDRTVIAQDGENFTLGDWAFEFIESKHGLFNTINLGVIVRNGADSFGHCGDTITFEGFNGKQMDAFAIPITGLVTTSPSKAIDELKKFETPIPTIVVMHWVIRNPGKFCERLSREIPGARCIVPEKGKPLPL